MRKAARRSVNGLSGLFGEVAGAVTGALDLVLPPECVWCQTAVSPDERLCGECRQVFERPYCCCLRCATPLPPVVDNRSCIRCRDAGWRFKRVIALGPYRGRLREAVILMKKPVFESLAAAVGTILAARMQSEIPSDLESCLVHPVPNHWFRRLTHRTSTAETLADQVAAVLGCEVSLRTVYRTRITEKQGMLAWSNRPDNVRNAFRVRNARKVAGRRILLVDDVVTSGATAAELSRTLLKAGAAEVIVAAAARGTGTRDSSTGTQSHASG